MRKRILPLIILILLIAPSTFAQKCGTYDGYLKDQVEKFPEYYKKLSEKNKHLKLQHEKALKRLRPFKNEDGKKIIPVVVHNIYNDQGGYISDSEIHAAIDALNKNFNGQSHQLLEMYQGQYVKTPDIFAAVRGIGNIEFRLAKWTPAIDEELCDTCPPSRPTTGINRIYSDIVSPGSDGPDPVKTLGYWNSYQYFNIWTVRSFDSPGLLGYAQFPNEGGGFGMDFMSTDGVVLLSSHMKDPESSTLTHEAGHWLGLRHIWGDGVCADDGIYDTPLHRYDNNGASTSSPTPSGHSKPTPALFPYHVGIPLPAGQTGAWGCVADSLNPAGEMFMNYMDYTTDEYTTMFSAGQVERMNVILEGEMNEETGVSGIGFREYMWSEENVIATGVADGYINLDEDAECNSDYDFFVKYNWNHVCLGVEQWFVSNSEYIDLNVTSATWDFDDGSGDIESDYQPTNSVGYNKKHTFDEPGSYDVTFTVEYEEVREVRVKDLDDLVEEDYDNLITETNILIVQAETEDELLSMGADNIKLHLDSNGYSLNSFWKKNEPNTDDILDATFIETNIITDDFGVVIDTTYNGYYGDSLFYRGELEEVIYVAQYISSCESELEKKDFVVIGDEEGENDIPELFSFEDESDLNGEWVTQSQSIASEWAFHPAGNTVWEWTDKASNEGDASIMINRNQLVNGSIVEIISEPYDLTDFDTPALRFSWSGASASTNPLNELNVKYSVNCGKLWSTLGTVEASDCANAGLHTTTFIPESNDWDTIVMTKSGLNNDNVMFKFEYEVNGSSNNFYLDNIVIGDEEDLLELKNLVTYRLSLFPNPSIGEPTISVENLDEMNIQVNLVNILGVEVARLFNGEVEGDYLQLNNIDWPKQLEKGIYFVTVVSNGNIITSEKFIFNK